MSVRHSLGVADISRPEVSVCIRGWRAEPIEAAIASVLAQTYGDFEVVVSDDSGDLQVVAGGFGDARVRYSRNPSPAGPAMNLSRVVGLARGRLIAILNDDDRWLPGFLATTVGVLAGNPGVGLVFTDDFFEVGGRRL